jgi:hypothetical protein
VPSSAMPTVKAGSRRLDTTCKALSNQPSGPSSVGTSAHRAAAAVPDADAYRDWQQHGLETLRRMREEDPSMSV